MTDHFPDAGKMVPEALRLRLADEALLWLCREMIRELPIVHPQQGPRRDELIQALNQRL